MNICLSVTKCGGSEVNPFSQSQFGINCNDDFIPFNTMGTIVYFESCVPTDWETRNLPIIMLTGEDWDPVNVGFGNGHRREQAEMQMIQSLEIWVTKRKMAVMKQREMDSIVEQWGQVEWELSKLSSTLHECLIGSVYTVMMLMRQWKNARQVC
jgi:hypothetical protein